MTGQPARRRLFVAVWPPQDLVAALEDLERPEAPGLRWTTREQWHVTLRFLGSVGEDRVAGLKERLGQVPVSGEFERPVVAIAGPRPEALGSGVWMLPVGGLERLAAAVEEGLEGVEGVGGTAGLAPGQAAEQEGEQEAEQEGGRAAGDRAGERPFSGHLTLARAKRPSLLRHLPTPALERSWEVQEVTLVNSTLHPRGARYDVIGRWGL